YEILSPATLILNIHALRTNTQTILKENILIEPEAKYDELLSVTKENRFLRIDITTPTYLKIDYKATVINSYTLTEPELLDDVPLSDLGPYELSFLNPSRYCQSDKLYRFANKKFGN